MLLHEELVDILCVAEHWMHDNNKDTYNIEGYTLGSCFARKTHKHGGVGIFVRENMIYTEIREIAEISIEKECEMCGLHLPQLKIIVVTVHYGFRDPVSRPKLGKYTYNKTNDV